MSWSEKKYWITRYFTRVSRSLLYRVMPRWVVRESMMYASRYIKPDEVVPDINFMTVFERVCKKETTP